MSDPIVILDSLAPFIGVEHPAHDVNHAMKFAVRQVRLPVVGAMHVTCSDEDQRESNDEFQRGFAQDTLPRLKHGARYPFQTTNLGGRYEWQSLQLAEQHFAAPESHTAGKTLVVKVNSHVAETSAGGSIPVARRFGQLDRYGNPSACCSALAAMMQGSDFPYAQELHEAMGSEGSDRFAALSAAPLHLRALYTAVVSARLQARSAVLEAQDYVPQTPTLYVIVPCVTINKPGRDTEVLVGVYLIDRRGVAAAGASGAGREVYRGLGDDPAKYAMDDRHSRFALGDDHVQVVRVARNHSQVIREEVVKRGMDKLERNAKVDELLGKAKQASGGDAVVSRVVAKGLVMALAEVSPVGAAALLFGQGLAGIYQAYRAHRLVRDVAGSREARSILRDVHERIDRLPAEEAQRIVHTLAAAYERR